MCVDGRCCSLTARFSAAITVVVTAVVVNFVVHFLLKVEHVKNEVSLLSMIAHPAIVNM